jgi:hypothetical protein
MCCSVIDLTPITARLAALEALMSAESDALNAVSAKVDDLVADVRAALDILRAERDSLGDEGQAALDELTAKVDAFDAEIGDADGSDTPPVPEAPVNP